MRAACGPLSEAVDAYGMAFVSNEESCLYVSFAHALAESIEGALWNLSTGETKEAPAVAELALAVQHVRRLLQQALDALRAEGAAKGPMQVMPEGGAS